MPNTTPADRREQYLDSTITIADGPYESDDIFLLYHPLTRKTGRRLTSYLGVPGGEESTGPKDVLIRWGCRRSVNYQAGGVTLNPRHDIRSNTDKLNSLDVMSEAGIPVPDYTSHASNVSHPETSDGGDLIYPVLGRASEHSQGSDINLILQERDLQLTDNSFYVDYIPTAMEYRVQVFRDDIIKVHEKRLETEAANAGNYTPHIRNHQKQWVFCNPRTAVPNDVTDYSRQAVDALGLDFGAVDVIEDEHGNIYVLEVNTAPTLGENNLRRYGEILQEKLGLDSVAGMDAVDWSDEDEGGDEDEDN
jgi:Glutathione synthase/Ribosomal protein S6 modification enzyme (glutaminyl transferase)